MKKLLIILLAGVFIAGCSNDDTSNESDTDNDQVTDGNGTEDESTDNDDSERRKDVYQIGETAKTTSSSYGFPYEITVNDFEVTTDEVDGYSMDDFDSFDDDVFVVVNVTLKNTGDKPFIPNDKISAQLIGELISETSYDEFFTEREEELEPGEEITGNVVYLTDSLYENDVVYFTYEAEATKEEVKFELPVPEK
ncbi:hypothetical protein JOC34_000233 [Virgibacillus halotolerans]|uniref:DUF4352 domain-containing protein n=1 Tax=Virgibacillus halotolerans TaxID=1071053 RepID=UPI00195FCA8B|nr:DUF4352 domain-containing protein [Virgibacillus halotolerans]MBM7597876.1 hypothetical protein [Virgibacillus halotolerans]